MDTATDLHNTQAAPSVGRRKLLAGTAGLAGAAVLAGCGQTHHKGRQAGLSGIPVTSTSVPPTVPVTKPSTEAIESDANNMATANSLELLLAGVYITYGPKLDNEELRTASARFANDHTKAAEVFAAQAVGRPGVGTPNEFLQTNQVDPIASLLNNDAAITALMSSLESSSAATYIVAAVSLVEPDWRQTMVSYAAAAARRSTIFGNGGEGSTPTAALYPMTDLIAGKAFLVPSTTVPA
ncbi:MAG: hypothetical protein ABIP03_03740 [Aquihabitans sp.]